MAGITSALGYWRETLNVHEGSKLEWQEPGALGLKVWVAVVDGKPVARVSRQPGHGSGCSAAINGWMWTTQQPGSAAERLRIKESPTRGFGSVKEAKAAVETALGITQTKPDGAGQGAVHNPFRRADRRKQFDGMIADYEARNSALFHRHGGENQSNNIGNAFWRGYHGQLAAWIDPETPLHIAYVAGREVARATGAK